MQHRDRNRFIARGASLLALVAALAAVGAARPAIAADEEGAAQAKKTARRQGPDKPNEPAVLQTKRRDPFVVPSRVKREPPKVEIKKVPQPIPAPGMDGRLTEYRNLVRASSTTGQAPPDKLSPYLVEELTVTGIFRTGEGYGAFVVAGPTRLTFFARPGMRTYDGIVKEIAPNGVRFARSVRYDDGSVRQSEEFRALRSAK